MDSFDSRNGGGRKEGSGGGREGDKSNDKSSGWSLETTKEEWKKSVSEAKASGSWLMSGTMTTRDRCESNPFQSISKYKPQDDDSSKARSESMRDELTRNYIRPPPNRVVHCCSFPCLCRPNSDPNELPHSSRNHGRPYDRDDSRSSSHNDRDHKSWFKSFSSSASSAQDRRSK